MPQTPQSQLSKLVINEQEARTELLATIAAGRELGPTMDETLASRYAERLNTLFPNPARDEGRLRGDVEALLASARSHAADADEARVKDFLKSALAAQPAPPMVAQPPLPPAPRMAFAPYIPMALGTIAIVAILAATRGEAAWMLFWLIPLFFWSGRGRRRMRYRRYGNWDGGGMGYGPQMPPRGSHRQLPPGDDPEVL